MKRLITERDVLAACKQRRTQLILPPHGIVTPAAADAARQRKIEIVRGAPPLVDAKILKFDPNSTLPSKVVLGSDHGGFELKTELVSYVEELGHRTEDIGTFSTDAVDYPDYAHLVAQRVARDETVVGIIVDGAGVGSAMAANKVPGVRAAACYDPYTARNSREHNFANVLALGSRVIGIDIARQIVKTWLETDYGAERHARRVAKIVEIEQKYRDS